MGKGGGRADAAKKDVVCILAKCVENCAPGVGYLSIPGRAEQSRARSSDDAANSFYQSSCSASSTNQGHNSMREGCRSSRGSGEGLTETEMRHKQLELAAGGQSRAAFAPLCATRP